MMSSQETIAAIATPAGRGGIGIVRISGALVTTIAKKIIGYVPKPRHAEYADFKDAQANVLDYGLAIYFPGPNSFTGEDVLELQGHGGTIILNTVLQRVLECGARMARPGEFSERAFLNDKIDLAQAEAIADLIEAGSEQAARAALRSLQGEFSKQINSLIEKLIHLRMYVEAAIDFPEEEIDFLSDKTIAGNIEKILQDLETIQQSARQGTLLRDGMVIVIAGAPNAGKSSLLNALSGRESAIVTNVPGTTRDILREDIQIDGLPLHIIDTAGLRESLDIIEQEGIRRALNEVEKADRILLVVDGSTAKNPTIDELINPIFTTIQNNQKKNNLNHSNTFSAQKKFYDLINDKRFTIIRNKIDLTDEQPEIIQQENVDVIKISAKNNLGMDLLRDYLKNIIGYQNNVENNYSARRRHLEAIYQAEQFVKHGQQQLIKYKAGELLAEDLRNAQQALSEITGEFHSDDLLGKIFSSFCIGK